MRGGKRLGAGRKVGSKVRPPEVLRKERALKELARVARAEKRSAADEAEAERLAEKLRRRDDRGERVRAEILPPLPMLPELKIPPDVAPLDFLIALMRQPQLPLGFRRDCAAMALPFAHAKPILGIKDARRLAALDDDDDDDDEIARAMRSN